MGLARRWVVRAHIGGDKLAQVLARQGAVGAKGCVVFLSDLPGGGLADLDRQCVGRLHHPEGAAVARASLHQIDLGARDQAQHLGRHRAHVLRPGVAGVVKGDSAGGRLETGREAMGLRKLDDILADVPRGGGEALDGLAFWQDQRPFELHHQTAAGGERRRYRSPDRRAGRSSAAIRSARRATSAMSPASSWGMPQHSG